MSSNDTENASASQTLVASQFVSTPFQESVFQDSVLSEVAPGVATSSPTGMGPAALVADRNTPPTDEEKILFPLLGSVSIPSLLRNLYFGLALFLSLTFTLTYYSFKHSEETALKVKTVGESLMQAQRMAKSANEALIGGAGGFDELRDSSGQLKSGLDRLEAGSLLDPLVGGGVDDQAKNPRLEDVSVLADRSLRAVGVILSQKMLLTGVSDSLKALNKSSDDLLDSIREIIAEKMKKSATTSEISALGEMAALSQRIAKSANEFFTTQGVSPQAVFLLRQDIASFETMTLALLNGDASLKLSPTKDPAIRAQIEALANQFKEIKQSAQQSAEVARQSLEASNSGLLAVQNTIGGMNTLREQIQETSKRIKRLGESSQEIGEITEIISDITEQTNVLALNAAIQAASAGEAGRGFAVVAEEVQRLAVRSAEATQQIANLVRAIQSDTQDAIGAMERSAQDVVSGATLSDKAGAALTDIDRITRRVADQVEQISETASREAAMANDVAKSIQHIFAVTEQTEKESLATSAEVQRLSTVANELRKSVTRFKVS